MGPVSHEKRIQRNAGNPRDDTDAHRKGKRVTIKAKNGVMKLQAKEPQGLLEITRN